MPTRSPAPLKKSVRGHALASFHLQLGEKQLAGTGGDRNTVGACTHYRSGRFGLPCAVCRRQFCAGAP